MPSTVPISPPSFVTKLHNEKTPQNESRGNSMVISEDKIEKKREKVNDINHRKAIDLCFLC